MQTSLKSEFKTKWQGAKRFVAGELGVQVSYLENSVIPPWLHSFRVESKEDFEHAIRSLETALRIAGNRIQSNESPLFDDAAIAKCKGATPDKLGLQSPCRGVAGVLARNLVEALDGPIGDVKEGAAHLRSILLDRTQIISLEDLLKLCWEKDIAVAHLQKAPRHAPHAMAFNIGGRYAIVLMRNKKHQGWHLFDLAHELGHIMLGHLKPGDSVVDGEEFNHSSLEESEANTFALELLAGEPESVKLTVFTNAATLLRSCKAESERFHVHPQWLMISVGHNWEPHRWGVVGKALNDGWPDEDALKTIEDVLKDQLREREVTQTHRSIIEALAVRR